MISMPASDWISEKWVVMSMQALTVREDLLKSLEDDFFRLLEMDRESLEFEELYRRFDAQLSEVLEPEREEALV